MPTYRAGYANNCGCCLIFERFHLNIIPETAKPPTTYPVVSGSLILYRYANGSGGILDRHLTLDVSSLTGMTPHEASLTTFTVPILEDGAEVGSLTYQWVSGDGYPSGAGDDLANVTVIYGNNIFRAADCYFESVYAQGFLCYGLFETE